MHSEDTGKVIEGLQLVFIELPKFKPTTFSGKKMRALWLRYLTEIDEKTRTAPPELLENPEVRKALGIVEESAYTEGEMYAYDEYWDAVRTEKTLFFGKWEEGKAEGLAEGLAQGMEEGKKQERLDIARKALQRGLAVADVAALTGLPEEEIRSL